MHFGCAVVAAACLGVAFLGGADDPAVAQTTGQMAADRPAGGDAGIDGKIDKYVEAKEALAFLPSTPNAFCLESVWSASCGVMTSTSPSVIWTFTTGSAVRPATFKWPSAVLSVRRISILKLRVC
jgi:hypothetical protein